jgi:Cft2 family RNA processing exonuclease
MKLIDLNRDGGIGANSLFIQIGDLNLLVDCGLHPKKTGRAATPDLRPLRDVSLDLVLITHCHLDHIGSLPLVLRGAPNTPVVMTSSSRMLVERMLHNSVNVMLRQREEDGIADYPLFTHEEVTRCARQFSGLSFGQARHFRGARDDLTIVFHPAGHVAGAGAIEMRHKHRSIFFTGDVLFDHQRTLAGAQLPANHMDTLVMETTRGNVERPAGKERLAEINRLITTANDTIQRGGSLLLPVFALGRLQEILAILHDARRFGRLGECPIYTGGLGVDLADYFDEIARKTRHVQFNRNILKELRVKPPPRQLTAGTDPAQNAIYVLSSGMMVEQTPSYLLASGLVGHARNTIGFVGYCDPDTPGGQLLATPPGAEFLFAAVRHKAKVKARVERFELSGHADREELLEFATQTGARSVVLTHGDPPARAWFAEQLARQMPATRVLDPVPLQAYQV